MSALTVSGLTVDAHHGTRARIGLSNGDIHEGTLSFAANPSYHRIDVRHWWLIVPSASRHFEHDAISLQWSGSAVVETLPAEKKAA